MDSNSDKAIIPINPKEFAEQIYRVFQDAYQIEADLIGADLIGNNVFPPLTRTVDDISQSANSFFAAFNNQRICAVIESETTETSHDESPRSSIVSLAVSSDYARQGLGRRLVEYVIERFGPLTVTTVTTAKKNLPAIALYKELGFVISNTFDTPETIQMVEMVKEREND